MDGELKGKLEELEHELKRLEREQEELKSAIYGHDSQPGLLTQLYEMKVQLRTQNKLIFLLISLVASEFALLVDILAKLGV